MNVPYDTVDRLLENDDWEAVIPLGVAPNTDSLGEEFYGIFYYNGQLLRVKYTQGCAYWRSQGASWDDAFTINEDDTVTCERVVRTEILAYRYEVME